jgi:hypothetical protein
MIAQQPREVRLKRVHWEIGSVETRRGVAYVFGDDDANARLITAAPSLLESLENICDYWNGSRNESAMEDALSHITETARAALALAKREKS